MRYEQYGRTDKNGALWRQLHQQQQDLRVSTAQYIRINYTYGTAMEPLNLLHNVYLNMVNNWTFLFAKAL